MSTEKPPVIANFSVAGGNHFIELAETPKGLIEAKIDGDPMSYKETKELAMWLNMVTEKSD